MSSPPRILIPPVQVLLWFGAGWLADRAAGPPTAFPDPVRNIGRGLVPAGVALILWSTVLFRRSGTSEKPWHAPKAFVTTGPYRFTRNPMYCGMVLVLAGIAMLRGSATMLIAPIGFMATVTISWIRYEESVLSAKFGDTYTAYRARVRRWI